MTPLLAWVCIGGMGMDATMNKMMTSITILQLAVGDVVKVMNVL